MDISQSGMISTICDQFVGVAKKLCRFVWLIFGMVDDDVSWKANNVVGAIAINNMMMIVVEEMKQRDSIMIWLLWTIVAHVQLVDFIKKC